jgi:hypothetical protein
MDAQTAQLRPQIKQTRAAMAAIYEAPRQPPAHAAAPPTPRDPTRGAPPDSRPSPWKFGGLGAKELARRVIAEIQDDDCLSRAAQLAYYFLFALFPFFLMC